MVVCITFPALMNLTMLNKWNIREGNYSFPGCVCFMNLSEPNCDQPAATKKLYLTPLIFLKSCCMEITIDMIIQNESHIYVLWSIDCILIICSRLVIYHT